MDTILTVAVYKGFITTFKTVPHTVVIKNACILTCLTARFIGEKKMFTKERREGAGPNCQVQRMPGARDRSTKEKVARVPWRTELTRYSHDNEENVSACITQRGAGGPTMISHKMESPKLAAQSKRLDSSDQGVVNQASPRLGSGAPS